MKRLLRRLLFSFKKKQKQEEVKSPIRPRVSTLVPSSFLKSNPSWDEHLYSDIRVFDDQKLA